ncbi:hypothetical protein CPB83DRAFT_9386 [Crepidotus variabilis]|uniref:NADH dehydrogenase [ubiquinone] 1 alpha subcomplex subunit 11 n=1 Tax=Crepidotus variabilis TaxID=179855 RepID=A0A9P6JVG9_9AGAR|nr:hypothetical protein CPB83DRAFT_9386 [Crepidotus variabilis]
MADSEVQTSAYEAKSPVANASNVALKAGAVGFFVSSLQNALGKHGYGAMGILTRTGGTVGFFAAMGGVFAYTEAYVANQRQQDDHLNGAAGGCAAGFLAGIKKRSLPLAVGSCAVLGAVIGAYDFTGSIAGDQTSTAERRKRFFKNPPKPLVETEQAAQ